MAFDYKNDISLAKHSSYKIGGNTKYFTEINNQESLLSAIKFCKTTNIKFTVIGRGSNVLFDDSGYEGMIIKLVAPKTITIDNNSLVFSGANLLDIIQKMVTLGFSGIECLAGIPGTLGGAIVMNAGAYGQEIKDVIKNVQSITKSGELKSYTADELQLGYRTSIFKHNNEIVVSAAFNLVSEDKDILKDKMSECLKKRKEKQPLNYPNCGSVFKRPNGNYAGALIEGSKLKGFSIGGAEVSDKHANFIINTGGATSANVKDLISHIQSVVKDNSGVELERELIYI